MKGISMWKRIFLVLCAAPAFYSGAIAAQQGNLRVELGAQQVKQYGRLEMQVIGVGEYERPGDPAEVRLDAEMVSPSGKKIVVPGFAMHKTREVDARGGVKWEPYGDWLWRIRFMPDEAGVYKGTAVLTARDGRRTSDEFSFEVSKSDSKGIIRVAKQNPWAFEYSNGSPYIAVGQNLCWAGGNRLENYRMWLDKMAANNCNFIRVWLGANWCFGVQGKEPYVYSEDAAELMDRVLELCEKHGIAIKLCLGDNINGYLPNNGGPFKQCETSLDFLTKESAKTQWKGIERYCVARYGASTSIFAWEMWNEMVSNFGNGDQVAAWTEEMCKYIKSIDPYGHLAGNSTGMLGLNVYRQPSVDFTQYHRYGGANHGCYETPQTDKEPLFEVFAGRLAELRKLGKPVLLAECGLTRPDWGPHPTSLPDQDTDSPKDTKGYAFHESLWMGFIDGGAGSGHTWWWDGMVDPWNYYPQFKPIAAFVSDIPLNKAPLPPASGKVEPENLRCFVRQNDWGAVAWVVNSNDGWYSLVMEARKPARVSGGKLTFTGLKDGQYTVQMMNPWSGETTNKTAETQAGQLTVALADFEIDTAVKVIRTPAATAAAVPPAEGGAVTPPAAGDVITRQIPVYDVLEARWDRSGYFDEYGNFAHYYGGNADGFFTYAFEGAPNVTAVELKARMSAEADNDIVPSETSDLTIYINDVKFTSENIMHDDFKGKTYSWKSTDPAVLKAVKPGQGNVLKLAVEKDAQNKHGLCIYGEAIEAPKADAVPLTVNLTVAK